MNSTSSFKIIAQRIAAASLLLAGFAITVATSPPPCDNNSDCGDDLRCIDGDCQRECYEDADCAEGVCSDQNQCVDEEQPSSACDPGTSCEVTVDAKSTLLAADAAIGLDVTIGPGTFTTSMPAQTRATLEIEFVAPEMETAEATQWTLNMPKWGISKTLDVSLSQAGATVTALEFGLDPSDDPCSTDGGCLLQFSLRRADQTAADVELTASVKVTLPEEPSAAPGISAAWTGVQE
jgi:hypothetical protein